jgi:hypothetical protein
MAGESIVGGAPFCEDIGERGGLFWAERRPILRAAVVLPAGAARGKSLEREVVVEWAENKRTREGEGEASRLARPRARSRLPSDYRPNLDPRLFRVS